MSTSKLLALSAAVALAATAAGAIELRGRVILEKDAGASRQTRGVLVYYLPADRGSPPAIKVPDEPFRVVTVRKEFNPRSLIVPVGATVRFPNQDNILHNVFSLSGSNRFDLGLYRRGEGEEVTFDAAGVVRIYCNVHHSMVAYVVVVETPFYTIVGADSGFTLTGLPPGRGKLTVWHERSEPLEIDLELPRMGPLDLHLEFSKPRIPRHRNKFGKPYSRRRGGRDYG
ncbi:MAG: methylamine utilization protein [Thermoanaerobaculia bacterium]